MKRSKYVKQWKVLSCLIIFLLLSFADLYIYFRMNTILIGTDTLFHYSRVQEIYENLKHGAFFTWISTHYFQQTGVGSYLFYPDVFLYIWALLKFIFPPVQAFYIWIALLIFLTYTSSFCSMYSYCKQTKKSILFSLIYTTMPYHLFLGLWNGTLGEFIAYTFLPIAFVGIYHIFWGNKNKWWLLALGMSLILYSHLVSAFIIVMFIGIVIIFKLITSHSSLNTRIFSLMKAAFLTVLMTCPFWFLFIIEGPVATPQNSFIVLHNLTDILNISIDNTIGSGIGLILLITVLIGGIFSYKKKQNLSIYLIGLFFFIASTNIIPYQIFNHIRIIRDTLGLIQMPGRLLSFSAVFLSVIAAEIITKVINKSNHRKLITALTITFSIVMFWSETLPEYSLLNKIPELPASSKKDQFLPTLKKISNSDYDNLFNYLIPAGETDYYHKTNQLNHSSVNSLTKSIINHTCYMDGKETKITPTIGSNLISYKLKTSHYSNIDLPIVYYPSDNVTINGKKVYKKISSRGTIYLHVNSGINNIKIKFEPPIFEYILMLVAILSWIWLISKSHQNFKA